MGGSSRRASTIVLVLVLLLAGTVVPFVFSGVASLVLYGGALWVLFERVALLRALSSRVTLAAVALVAIITLVIAREGLDVKLHEMLLSFAGAVFAVAIMAILWKRTDEKESGSGNFPVGPAK